MMRRTKKNKRPSLAIVRLLVIGGMVSFLFWFVDREGWKEDNWEVDTYSVEKGDTLWSIGKEIVGEDKDVREWIYQVERLNGFSDGKLRCKTIKVYTPKKK